MTSQRGINRVPGDTRMRRMAQTMSSIHGTHSLPPVYSTATRPQAGVRGRLCYNTTTATIQYDDGVTWKDVGSGTTVFESNVWYSDTDVTITDNAFIYWRLTVGPGWTVGLEAPRFGGQIVTLVCDVWTAGTGTLDTSLWLGGYTLYIRSGTTDYQTLTLNAVGDSAMLQGVHRNGELHWHVVTNNGCALA